MLTRDQQIEKALSPIDDREEGSRIDERDTQKLKVSGLMIVTEVEDRSMSTRDLQLLKASVSMVLTEFGIITVTSLSQPWNADTGMASTFPGISYAVS